MLACRREFAALQPELSERLTACVLEACRWLDAAPANRAHCAQWLAEPQHIGVPATRLAVCLGAHPEVESHVGCVAAADDATALAFHCGGW